MYLLDTDVTLEFRKIRTGKADKNVAIWEAGVPASVLFLSTITIFELERRTLLLGRRDPKQGSVMRTWLNEYVLAAFAARMFPVDTVIATLAASLQVLDPRPERAALIGATALVHRMTVVTRNVADFTPIGVPVLNPWDPQPTP